MKRITITELESFGTDVISTAKNLVYVPGFAWTGATGEVAIKGEYRKPHICYSLSEFEEYFGTTAPRFKDNQLYPYHKSGSTPGFSQIAIPGWIDDQHLPVWYKGSKVVDGTTVFGDADPSWLYAHELIASGVPVLYERVNKGATYPLNSQEYSATAVYNKQDVVWYSTTDQSTGQVYTAYFICHTATTAGTAPAFTATYTPTTNNNWTPWCGHKVFDKNITYEIGTIAAFVTGTTVVYKKFKTKGTPTGAFEAIPEYDATSSYAVGDFVTHTVDSTATVYCCKTAVTGPKAWTSTDWTDNTVATNVKESWTAGNTYALNDVVKTGTSPNVTYWRCKEAHTAAGTWEADQTKFVKNFGDHLIINAATYTSKVDGEYYFDGSMTTPVLKKWVITNNGTTENLDTAPSIIPIYDVTVNQFYYELIGDSNADPILAVSEDATENSLADAALYNIAFITTGGYPNFEYLTTGGTVLANKLATIAFERKDAVALIDHTDSPDRALVGVNSVFDVLNGSGNAFSEDHGKHAAMITPWGFYNTTVTNTEFSTVLMPASFGYLKRYGATLAYNDQYLAIAGVNRGCIPDLVSLNTTKNLTNTIAERMQKDPDELGTSINPITYITGYGYCIMGNRTLLVNTVANKRYASHDLNLRNTCNEIKKAARAAGMHFLFEQNTNILWLDFKNEMVETLSKIQAKNVISDYQFIQLTSTNKAKVACQIKIWPVKAVESFDINIVLTDTDVTVA